jgi:hypothetical protein
MSSIERYLNDSIPSSYQSLKVGKSSLLNFINQFSSFFKKFSFMICFSLMFRSFGLVFSFNFVQLKFLIHLQNFVNSETQDHLINFDERLPDLDFCHYRVQEENPC